MIVHDSHDYRIEDCPHIGRQTGLRFALDYKERKEGRVCLVNLGWFDSPEKAHQAKNQHWLKLEGVRNEK